MSADTLSVYRHSGKFTAQGLALTLGGAVLINLPLGLAYAHLVHWVPFIYFNVIATCAYGFSLGLLTVLALKAGRMRNTPVALLCAFGVGAIAVYFLWSGHVHAIMKDPPRWIFTPDEIWRVMQWLYANGAWSLSGHHGVPVTGLALAAVWVLEAAIIVGPIVWLTYQFVTSTPFCEKSKSWLDDHTKFDTLEAFTDDAQIAALEAGSIQPLIDAKPRVPETLNWARLTLKRTPSGQDFCTLRVENVYLDIDGNGKATEKTLNLTGDLIIPASMFELVAQFARVSS